MKGQVKAGKGTLVGNAGEYYVMAELLKRGIVAALAPRNSPSFDILAAIRDRTIRIRVKTKSEEYNSWQWMAKADGLIFREIQDNDDFTILVNLTADTANLEYYIVPTKILNEWLIEDFNRWVNHPGAKGQQRNPENRFRAFGCSSNLEKLCVYKNKWEILWV
jgi:hypothetical protein